MELPLRTNFPDTIRQACALNTEEAYNETGVAGPYMTPFLDLPGNSLHIARGAPMPTQHALAIGAVGRYIMAWRGKLPHDTNADPAPPYIIEHYWPDMGAEIEASRKYIPLQLGAPLGNIHTGMGTFKRRVRDCTVFHDRV